MECQIKTYIRGTLINLVPYLELNSIVDKIYSFVSEEEPHTKQEQEMLIKGVLLEHTNRTKAVTRVTFDILNYVEQNAL